MKAKEDVILDKTIKEVDQILKKNKKENNKMKFTEKTIKLSTLVLVALYTAVVIAGSSYLSININNSINNSINSQVQSKTAEQVKVFTQELEK